MITKNFSNKVLNWFDHYGRKDLPWQQPISPYRVWVSEIMLQQTQVKTVIPYFEAFIKSFPDIKSLAQAALDDILALWSGLGYYARARNLHLTAQKIMKEWGGEFPETIDALCSLPGIGKSTAGAILSISFGKRAAILDGNVRRVLCRFHAIEGFHGNASVQKKLWELAEEYTPKERVGTYTQAMMDLGAIICKRIAPLCLQCPLQEDCLAYQQGTVNHYPNPKPKKIKPIRSCYMLLLFFKDTIFLYKRPQTGIWGGLWSLPEFSDKHAIEKFFVQEKIICKELIDQPVCLHTFTHFQLQVIPVLAYVDKRSLKIMEGHDQAWHNLNTLEQLGLSALVKKILVRKNVIPTRMLASLPR